MKSRIDQQELKRFRCMDASTALLLLADYVKADPTFEPIKDKASERWHVTAGGQEFEMLTLGPKFYGTRQKRGGGGAIDLVMHLYRLDFKWAIERLREAL